MAHLVRIFSIAGQQKGADPGTETKSSLMWETIRIIQQMGIWKPKYVIWENVKNVLSAHMIHNFNRYLSEMQKLGYVNSFEVLDARDFGLPQARQRVFTISSLDGVPFEFDELIRTPMKNVWDFIQDDSEIDDRYTIVSPSNLSKIDESNYDNAPLKKFSVIKNYTMTISTYQDRCPNAGIIKRKNGTYRLLTELECWRLQGYSDEDYYRALSANPGIPGKKNGAMYKQAGNSIAVPKFESIFRKMLLGEIREVEEKQLRIGG